MAVVSWESLQGVFPIINNNNRLDMSSKNCTAYLEITLIRDEPQKLSLEARDGERLLGSSAIIESVPTKKVFAWVKVNIGQSVQSKKGSLIGGQKFGTIMGS